MKVTNEKGVTLISLIITVVILLVLLLFTDLIIPDDVADKANEAEQYTSGLIADAQNTITNIKNGLPNIDETIEDDGTKDDIVNNAPLISAHVSNIDKTTATITAVGSDADGDALQYTLIVDGQTYGPTATGLWNLTGLLDNMKYNYTVKVTDGKTIKVATGTFTTLRANYSPEIEYFSVEEKTTNSFTVKIKATDKENDELTYKLYLYTDKWGTETGVATVTVPAGEEVELTATAVKGNTLQANTQYWWYVGVLDGINTIVSTERQTIITKSE